MIVADFNQFDFNHFPDSVGTHPYVITFNGRSGAVALTADDVENALGFVPGVGGGGGFTQATADTLYAPIIHSHIIADVTGLQAALDGKQVAGSYALSGHTHIIADVTGLQAALDSKLDDSQAGAFGLTLLGSANLSAAKTSLAYTKSDVGLGNADNTSDVNKPVSTAQQTALDAKLDDTQAGTFGLTLLGSANLAAAKASLAYVKADVGLGSVDNTADAAKNVLTATKLLTARNINGVAFDGTGDITIGAVDPTARVPTTRTISTTAPLAGGGDLSADRTLSITAATSGAAGSMSAADKTKLDAITGTNTGDQTSIVGITGTLAEFNTALTGADFASGGGTATGTNTGDQTITLTGDVTGSGTGSFATTINASFYKAGGTDVALADGGTGASLVDPNADRIMFWDDSAGQVTWLTLGTNLSITGTTLDAAGGGGSPGGSDRQVQYNNATAFAGADHVDIDAQGDLRFDTSATPATPGADQLSFAPQRITASSRVLPRFREESGVFNTMQAHLGRNNVCGVFFSGGTAITQLGINLTAIGTATARAPATTNRLTRTKRTAYVSAATAGAAGGLASQTISNFSLGSGTVLGGGGFFAVWRWAASDAATVAGAHMFLGMQATTAAPTATTNPSAFTNCVGVAQLNGGTNLNIVYGGSAAQTPIDLGASFPAGSSSTTNGGLYELILYAPPTSNNTVYYRVERIDTGDVTQGTLTGTAGTALPANSTFLGPRMFRSNNATALAIGIDLGGFTIESDL